MKTNKKNKDQSEEYTEHIVLDQMLYSLGIDFDESDGKLKDPKKINFNKAFWKFYFMSDEEREQYKDENGDYMIPIE